MQVRGYSLTELLVALLLGSLVLLAACRLLATTGATLTTRDSAADLAARAALSLDAVEADVRLAGFYGLTNDATGIGFLQGGDTAAALPAAALSQSAPALPAVPGPAHACGSNYAIDLSQPISADNNRFQLGHDRTSACAARGGAVPGADTLTVRHAAARVAAAVEPGRLQLLVSRTDPGQRWLFNDGTLPVATAPEPLRLQLHDLSVQAYYVARSSVGMPSLPALRLKSLTAIGGAAAFTDTEVMPGVEDLQVRLLTTSGDHDPGTVPPGEAVRAVRVWLLLRAEHPEPGFTDPRVYAYADRRLLLDAAQRRYRRLLASRTIALRNAALP